MAAISERILNIAHRGASAAYPENTMAAFKGAVDMGADMIELDVRLSRDGIPVIFHNQKLNTPINAAGYLAESNLADLKKLDAGSWFHANFASEQIPTLEEVLAWASATVALNIELKTDGSDTGALLEKKCITLIDKYKMKKDVLVSSFDTSVLRHMKELESTIQTALLFTKHRFKHENPSTLMKRFRADVFHCTFTELTSKRLADLNSHHISVNVYTINSKKRMKRLIPRGVNGIITDHPEVLRDVIKQQNGNL